MYITTVHYFLSLREDIYKCFQRIVGVYCETRGKSMKSWLFFSREIAIGDITLPAAYNDAYKRYTWFRAAPSVTQSSVITTTATMKFPRLLLGLL